MIEQELTQEFKNKNISTRHSWHIIMPVYNEEESLDETLRIIFLYGYLKNITIVNDASTDSSKAILNKWHHSHGLNVVHLSQNRKKEGAIREVMIQKQVKNQLAEYTVILDADSYIKPSSNISVAYELKNAINHMESNDIVGMAFRINAIVPEGLSLIEKCIYSDYAGMQFDNSWTSKQYQLWVINGPGGIFNSEKLLASLNDIILDFETGDLAITVNLMHNKEKVAFWNEIDVHTRVPSKYHEYFNQRRRWERGTIKVLWRESSFYVSLLLKWKYLTLMLLIYIIFHLGIMSLPLFLWFSDNPTLFIWKTILFNYIFWSFLTSVKTLNLSQQDNISSKQIMLWGFMNGVLFLAATGFARIVGFWEAIYYLVRHKESDKKGVDVSVE